MSLEMDEDAIFSGILSGSDVDGDLTFTILENPFYGTIELTIKMMIQLEWSLVFVFILAQSNGTDRFTYSVTMVMQPLER